ncbi:MAG: helix-turn-helix domain-containing protein, partial [Candidatus Binataceae bacterium]
ETAMRTGQLREDLYYRLEVNSIRVPPLRDRLEDIPLLVEHFTALFNEKLGRSQPIAGIEPEALAALQRHTWPGNVRELANAIESAFTFGHSPTIRLEDLPVATARSEAAMDSRGSAGPVPSFAEVERDLIRRALESTAGNKVQAARLLRISRKKLYAKIEKYRLT